MYWPPRALSWSVELASSESKLSMNENKSDVPDPLNQYDWEVIWMCRKTDTTNKLLMISTNCIISNTAYLVGIHNRVILVLHYFYEIKMMWAFLRSRSLHLVLWDRALFWLISIWISTAKCPESSCWIMFQIFWNNNSNLICYVSKYFRLTVV